MKRKLEQDQREKARKEEAEKLLEGKKKTMGKGMGS